MKQEEAPFSLLAAISLLPMNRIWDNVCSGMNYRRFAHSRRHRTDQRVLPELLCDMRQYHGVPAIVDVEVYESFDIRCRMLVRHPPFPNDVQLMIAPALQEPSSGQAD